MESLPLWIKENTDKGKLGLGRDRSADNQKMDVMETHSYARCSSPELKLTPVPGSEPCTPDPKESKSEPTLAEVQNNIMQILVEKMNQNTKTIHHEIKQNRERINTLKEATELSPLLFYWSCKYCIFILKSVRLRASSWPIM